MKIHFLTCVSNLVIFNPSYISLKLYLVQLKSYVRVKLCKGNLH